VKEVRVRRNEREKQMRGLKEVREQAVKRSLQRYGKREG